MSAKRQINIQTYKEKKKIGKKYIKNKEKQRKWREIEKIKEKYGKSETKAIFPFDSFVALLKEIE